MAERIIVESYQISNPKHLGQLIREKTITAGGTWGENREPTEEEIKSFIETAIHGMLDGQKLEWAISWFQNNSFRAGLSNVEISIGETEN